MPSSGTARNVTGTLCAASEVAACLQKRFAHLGEIGQRLSEHDIGRHYCSQDRVAACPHTRYANRRIAVQNRFYLLRIYLLSAHVDHSFAAPEEIIAIAAALDQVAGIDKPLLSASVRPALR